MEDAGIPLRRGEGRCLLERLEAVLRGLAILRAGGSGSQRLADELAELVAELDRAHQGWREADQS